MRQDVQAKDTLPAAPLRPPSVRRDKSRWNIAEWFILSQTVLPALLYIPGTQFLRIPIRMAVYGISLAVLAYFWIVMRARLRRSTSAHPAVPWLIACLVYLGLMLMHPTTNSYLAGIAQIGLYLAILAPVIWAPAFVRRPLHLRRLLWLLLFCNGINAFVGVMQAHDPGIWMPREFSSVVANSDYGLASLSYIGADGQRVLRPPGLGDTPGAVCGPALFALYFGLVFAVVDRVWWKKLFAGVAAILGATAIFLTLVRSSFLIAIGMIVVYIVVQIGQGRVLRAGALITVGFVAIAGAFIHSASIGGDNITSRFATIIEQNPKDFYMDNRGGQVQAGIVDLLPTYPFGAGLGRYGMMGLYFGNRQNPDSPPIWVEIQIPAWIVDGGIIMLALYGGALFITLKQQVRYTFSDTDGRVRLLSGIVLAGNAGLLALCFSYAVFLSPVGMQFWFLSGALQGIARKLPKKAPSTPSTHCEFPIMGPILSAPAAG